MQTTIFVYAPAIYGNPTKNKELKDKLWDDYESKPTISQNLSEGELYCMRCMVVTLCIMMRAVDFIVRESDQTDVIKIEYYSDDIPDEEENVVKKVKECDGDARRVEV